MLAAFYSKRRKQLRFELAQTRKYSLSGEYRKRNMFNSFTIAGVTIKGGCAERP